MAYVVLALGVVMAAIGLDAIATGYPIIQVERGWATVISGSVMLTGGLVTVALGLAIRTLAEIRAALQAQPSLAPAPVSAPAEPPHVVTQTAPAGSLPAHDVVPALGGAAVAAAALKTTEPPPHEAQSPLHDDPLHDDPLRDEPPREPMPGLFEAPRLTTVEPAPRRPEPDRHAADPARTDAPALDGYELQTPSTPEHDIARDEPLPSPTEEEDWLDRALSDFESGLSPTHPAEVLAPEHVSNAADDAAAIQAEVPPLHPEPAVDAPIEAQPEPVEPFGAKPSDTKPSDTKPFDAKPFDTKPVETKPLDAEHADAASADTEPVSEPPAPPAHEPAPHDLAVIGRYESDGTSYVMYADGSIEAQSDAGVYRFRSMAELKAFIEG